MKAWEKLLIFLVLLLSLLVLVPWLWLSGPRNGGFLVFGPHDTLWHLSLILELKKGLPPGFPGMTGVTVKNYNYLGDLLLAFLAGGLQLLTWQFYFRLGNFLVIGGFLVAIFIFAKKIAKSWIAGVFSLLLASLGGTAAYLIPLINSQQKEWQPNAFMLSPLNQQLTNLHVFLASTVFLLSLFFHLRFFQNQKIKDGVGAGIFMGLLFGIKALYFLPFFLAAGFIALLCLRKKEFLFSLPFIVGLIVTLVLAVFLLKEGPFPFEFRPFWLLQKMVEDPNRFYWPARVLRDQHYLVTHNIFGPAISQLQKLFLYLIGGLWLRLIGIFWLAGKVSEKDNSRFYQLLLATILFSVLLPLFIVPNPDHYNAAQLGSLGLFLASVILGISLKDRPLVFLVIFALMVPTTFKTQPQVLFIDHQEYEALNFLKTKTELQAVVMDLVSSHEYYMVVPALAQRKTYFSGTKVADLIGIDYHQRLGVQEKLLRGELTKEEFSRITKENDISFIFSPTNSFDEDQEEKYGLKKVFRNSAVEIYSVGH